MTRFEEIFEEYKIIDNCLLAFYWEKDECNRVHLFLFMVK
ncbi:hypothetical protein SPAR139_0412 [Streptococcus pneumoniae EU-NP04]|nr:hypothetical protein SPAR87_1942 [Streptococcus pneumoniae GA47033]EHZ95738.1 hypothetical protein SPAR139_0412 [Streptococcus pneumoniae EU-NP04]EJG99659.1 hypothetical protein SPAR162_0286 [Streptococcus pneumoniae GA60190]